MATVRIVTKKEQKAEARSEFRIVCKGISKKEFGDLYRVFKDDFGCRVALRNPFPPAFDAKAVHEIIGHVTGDAIGGYAAKKAIDAAMDLFVAFMKHKFMKASDEDQPRRLKLYGPNDKVLYEFKDKRSKTKKK